MAVDEGEWTPVLGDRVRARWTPEGRVGTLIGWHDHAGGVWWVLWDAWEGPDGEVCPEASVTVGAASLRAAYERVNPEHLIPTQVWLPWYDERPFNPRRPLGSPLSDFEREQWREQGSAAALCRYELVEVEWR